MLSMQSMRSAHAMLLPGKLHWDLQLPSAPPPTRQSYVHLHNVSPLHAVSAVPQLVITQFAQAAFAPSEVAPSMTGVSMVPLESVVPVVSVVPLSWPPPFLSPQARSKIASQTSRVFMLRSS